MEILDSFPLPCLIRKPRGTPSAAGRWPVLLFLHGYDEAAPTPVKEALTRHGPLSAASAAAEAERFIVVAPQLPLAGDIWHRYGPALVTIVTGIHAQYQGDPARSYLTGFSFGGNGVFDLALAYPSLWAALWPVDPTRVPTRDPRLPVWLSLGEVSRRLQRQFVTALRLQASDGDAAGLWHDDGADHVGSARIAYGERRIYDWLLRHSTPQQ